MRVVSLTALIMGVILCTAALGTAKLEHDREVSDVERLLVAETDEHAGALETYFARARSSALLTANSPAFSNLLAAPGTRAEKVRRGIRPIREATQQLAYLEQLYPRSIGEVCLIGSNGAEYTRVVHGRIAPPTELSTTEQSTTFFAPTFAQRFGQVHQPRPYVSPDTQEWVVANATLIPQADGGKRAIAHFEVTIESFRRALGTSSAYDLRVVDGKTGAVIIDSRRPQRIGAPLGTPGDRRFASVKSVGGHGITKIDGHPTAYRRIRRSAGNVNDWVVLAGAPTPIAGVIAGMGPAPIAMLVVALAIIALAAVSLRSARRELEAHASTDALTGLGNRRKLLVDLERMMRTARAEEPFVLTLFDLNGFKNYNDSFGHPAGDALLARLGTALAKTVREFGGQAYRQGGDEFCVIASAKRMHAMEAAANRALAEQGEGFKVTTAYGSVVVPLDTGDAAVALRKADQAMYAQKYSERATAGRQSSDVLMRALAERHPDLGDHLHGVAELAEQVGERLGIAGHELATLVRAASLHDIGKVAIPDAILGKPGPLAEEEWRFMRRHTLIGERILAAAPALGGAAALVRSSHETWDGSGYPDELAGIEIPLGARIIAVCDAFDAMISNRPYSKRKSTADALAELRRCAGTQFDPTIVATFEQLLTDRGKTPTASPDARA
jgi:diguanylate cyclase (GGDEF)-like protein